MKNVFWAFLLLLFLPLCGHSQVFKANNPSQLLEVKITNKRFDLSGIASDDKAWYVIADKPYNHFLYEIAISNEQVVLKDKRNLPVSGLIDLEGVDYAGGAFFFCNERDSHVYRFDDGKWEVLNIDWGDLENDQWGNKGLEGIAIDSLKQVIFLGKERQPQKIFETGIKGGPVKEVFTEISRTNNFHVSDLKMRGKYLYILDRNKYRVIKINTVSEEISSQFDYSEVLNYKNEKFYQRARYPMAEALLLTENQVIIGLDNNGKRFNSKNKFIKQAGLKGRNPVIIIFERPEAF